MMIIHPHAKERMTERGINEKEVIETLEDGECFPVKFGRNGFRRNFIFNDLWRGKKYNIKQVEVITVNEDNDIIIITAIAKYF
ncbi:MAG: DUF4258 domain-containing protein [Candidatus Acididesulfobacter guangdongensis]|uniref:DUF4258 domain-containing protein n=1 Tax=Acididesulfobacter guangdongensis TaxID=2597225 RepID=A0A519BHV6_ACIG2|nr:MAG: DUF4258 domain-containing protein [Candidatus Acididesulfobacter guangdongensis]